MRVGSPLMKNILTPLPKNVLISLGLTPAASVTDASVWKIICGSGMITLKISNKEMKDVKMVTSLEESDLLITGVGEEIENEAKWTKR